ALTAYQFEHLEGHRVAIKEGRYRVLVDVRKLVIENAALCNKCDGRGEVMVSPWKPAGVCYRCNGKRVTTLRDDQIHAAYVKRRYGEKSLFPVDENAPPPF